MAKCKSCSFPLDDVGERIFCPSCGAMIEQFKPPAEKRREPSMDKGKRKPTKKAAKKTTKKKG